MKFGAAGYCTKPFNAEEITDILTEVRARIERRKQMASHELLLMLQEREQPEEAELDQLLERLGFRREQGLGIVAVVVRGTIRHVSYGGRSIVPIRIGKRKTAYLLGGGDRGKAIEELSSKLLAEAEGVGVSGAIAQPAGLRKAIEEAVEASYRPFTAGEKKVGEAPPAELQPQGDDGELDDMVQHVLEEGFRRRDLRLIREGMAAVEAHFRSGRYSIRHAYRLYNWILGSVYKTATGGGERYMNGYDELVSAFLNVYEMNEHLLWLITDSFSEGNEGSSDGRGEETFARIVSHVRDKFREPLSLQDMAKRFYMHPNYVSQLFKKELNVSFTRFVTDIRMEYAGGLLRNTSLSVGEIAEQAGYNDYFYFARTFKKHTGVTPTEYRAKS